MDKKEMHMKGRIQIALFAEDKILYIEESKISISRLLELIHKLSRIEKTSHQQTKLNNIPLHQK